MLRNFAALAFALAAVSSASDAQSRPGRRDSHVRRFAELTAADLARLDRAKTVVMIPGSIIEEHGPYLPVYADGYRNERITGDIATAIVRAHRDWTVLIFPVVPLGSGPFNTAAGRVWFPGSVPVRSSTVRAVFMDLADGLGAQGFRYVFVVNGHGDPDHNRALDQAGDYFHDTYGGLMVHLLGRDGCQPESMGSAAIPPKSLFDSAATVADGASPHAGAGESARTRFLRPDLVPNSIVHARDITAPSPADWRRVASDSAWPGYVGAPRHASVALGRWQYALEVRGCSTLALQLLGGRDEKTVGRYADRMRSIPPLRALLDSLLAAEDSAAARQAAWLKRQP